MSKMSFVTSTWTFYPFWQSKHSSENLPLTRHQEPKFLPKNRELTSSHDLVFQLPKLKSSAKPSPEVEEFTGENKWRSDKRKEEEFVNKLRPQTFRVLLSSPRPVFILSRSLAPSDHLSERSLHSESEETVVGVRRRRFYDFLLCFSSQFWESATKLFWFIEATSLYASLRIIKVSQVARDWWWGWRGIMVESSCDLVKGNSWCWMEFEIRFGRSRVQLSQHSSPRSSLLAGIVMSHFSFSSSFFFNPLLNISFSVCWLDCPFRMFQMCWSLSANEMSPQTTAKHERYCLPLLLLLPKNKKGRRRNAFVSRINELFCLTHKKKATKQTFFSPPLCSDGGTRTEQFSASSKKRVTRLFPLAEFLLILQFAWQFFFLVADVAFLPKTCVSLDVSSSFFPPPLA